MVHSRYLVMLSILILLCPAAHSVGISGAGLSRSEIFVPNQVYNFSFSFHANTQYDNNYDIFARGKSLKPYVTFSQTRFEGIKKDAYVPFSGSIRFPEELNPPGTHSVRICVLEDCPVEGTVCGRASACARLNFMVLHKGIFPVVSLSIPNTNKDSTSDISVKINNLGEEDIKSASGRIEIYNLDKETVKEIMLDKKSIASSESDILSGILNSKGLLPGDYSATAFITADGVSKEANSSFKIGELKLDIKNSTNALKTGGIRSFELEVESAWNDPIKAYFEVAITDGNISTTSKSSTDTVLPWKKLKLSAFIDTSNLESKEYKAVINLHYNTQITSIEKIITLIPGKKNTNDDETPTKKTSIVNITSLTIAGVIIIFILTILNIMMTINKKKKP